MKQIKEHTACPHKKHFVKMCSVQQSDKNIVKVTFSKTNIKTGISVLH